MFISHITGFLDSHFLAQNPEFDRNSKMKHLTGSGEKHENSRLLLRACLTMFDS